MAVSDQTMLDNIDTAINNRLSGGAVDSYEIGGRNLKYCSLTELYELKRIIESRIASTTVGNRTIKASFLT